MENNRPRGREKNVTSGGKGVSKRGDGLGTGPVGVGDGYAGKTGGGGYTQDGQRDFTAGGGTRRRSPLMMIIVLAVMLLGGGGGLSSLLGGGNTQTLQPLQPAQQSNTTQQAVQQSQQTGGTSQGGVSSYSSMGGLNPFSLMGGGTAQMTSSAGSHITTSLNREVAAGSREKYTQILGNNQDTVTFMIYICGTDLESRSQMATNDIREIMEATISDKINVILYTGGCVSWRNNVVSSRTNQIYQVKDGELICLESNVGQKAMTDPATLTEFINYCKRNFPANRNNLIFWDHGGGSVSGYGYDEKFKSSGSMSLAGINTALKNADMKFDFIGFDTCLMATVENALMLNSYADYMVASEETEPGIGWFYTNWLTEFSRNTSMPTIELGKLIIDEFVRACNVSCPGQKTTLSIIDLAELAHTVPSKLSDFSKSISGMIRDKDYKTVSNARYNTREFAQQTRIDQVDLVHLAKNLGNEDGAALADALLDAVKYNRTSSNMNNAYGVSIYFPYQKTSNVDKAVSTYNQIGMDDDYAACIREFAALETSGQVAGGGMSSPIPSLLGTLMSGGSFTGSSAAPSGGGDAEMIGQLLGTFLGGGFSTIEGLSSSNTGFLSGRSMPDDELAQYLADNYFDPSALMWQEQDGNRVISLPEEQWSLVHGLTLNMFYDDGEGYIDLGLDTVYDFTDEGALLAPTDRTWLSIDGQPVAYYHLHTEDDGENYSISGRVPALLNGERVNLLLTFDNENPYGFIAGVTTDYVDGETETIAKSVEALQAGDVLEFVCDYYDYEGNYQDSYLLGEPLTVREDMEISNTDVGEGDVLVSYRFTDLYNQEYWTESLTISGE